MRAWATNGGPWRGWRTLVLLLALLAVPLLSRAADTVERFVATDALNVRAEPALDAPVVGKLPRGAKVQAHAAEGKWTRVEFDGKSGWAWSELLSEQPVAARSGRRRSTGTEHAAASDDGDSNIGLYVVIALVLGGILKFALDWKPSRCTLCRNTIERNYYRWTLEGRRHYLCPECNRRQRRWNSASASRR